MSLARNCSNTSEVKPFRSFQVQTTPEKLEDAALILRLGLPFTLIRHAVKTVNGAFRKRSSNRRNLETAVFRSSVNGKHFEIGTFRKRRYDNHGISLTEFSNTAGFNMTGRLLYF